jgi:hypothetical protein
VAGLGRAAARGPGGGRSAMARRGGGWKGREFVGRWAMAGGGSRGLKCEGSGSERRVAARAVLHGRVACAATCGDEWHSTAVAAWRGPR